MTKSLTHRGPDSSGVMVCPTGTVYLGFRRLAIRDLDPRADQPMRSASGRTWIAFNGEIYNTKELAARFCPSAALRTTGDTEVFLESFENHGDTILADCNGMFGVAFYEPATQTITLARDRMGKKPLYCFEGNGFLAFSSELRAFRPFGLQPNPEHVPYFLHFGYFPSPHTFFKNVTQVRPGEAVLVRRGRIIQRWRYHDPAQWDWGHNPSLEHESLDELLRDSATIRTQSDVPVGVFLSGGIDSTLVAAQLKSERDPRLPTFTVSFDEAQYNEAPFAKEVADHLGLPNIEIHISTDQLPDLLEEYLDCYEQPYADHSGFPSMLLCREVKQHVTVALSGDGGDEFFGGYDRYVWFRKALMAQKTPALLRRFIRQWLPRVDQRRGVRMQRLLQTQDPAALYANIVRVWTAEGRISDVLCDVPGTDVAPAQLVRDVFNRLHGDPLSKAACFDASYYIPDDLQVKMDRASMRYALEVRCPLLDHRFARTGAELTTRFKYHGGQKSVLKRLLERHLPRKTFERPKKGFGVPMAQWLRGPLRGPVRDALANRSFHESGWLDQRVVRRVCDQFQCGRSDLATPVWLLFLLARSLDAAEPAIPFERICREFETRRVA